MQPGVLIVWATFVFIRGCICILVLIITVFCCDGSKVLQTNLQTNKNTVEA